MQQTFNTIILCLQVLASPIAIGIIGWIYLKVTKKKANTDLVQQVFVKILATVKSVESSLVANAAEVIPDGQVDPRMQKAIDLFNEFKTQLPVKIATEYLGIDLNNLTAQNVQDILEKLLHANKLSMNFDVVTEIKNILGK